MRRPLAIGTDGTIYVWTGILTALHPDGSVAWAVSPTPHPTALPLAVGGDGTVRVVDDDPSTGPNLYVIGASGMTLWTRNLGAGVTAVTPLTMGPDGTMYLVLAGSTGAQLVALTSDARPKWSADVTIDSGQTTTLSVGPSGWVYAPQSVGVSAFGPDGTPEWPGLWTEAVHGAGPLAVAGDGLPGAIYRAATMTSSGTLYGFGQGWPLWSAQTGAPQGAMLVDMNLNVYAAVADALDAGAEAGGGAVTLYTDGHRDWGVPGSGIPSAMGSDGTIYSLAPMAGPFSTLTALAPQ